MSYKSILVNINIDGAIAPIVNAAIELACRHNAKLIGHCAADASVPLTVLEGGALSTEAWRLMRSDITEKLNELHAEFDHLTKRHVRSEWRQSLMKPAPAIIEASRAANVIIMAGLRAAAIDDSYRLANPAIIVPLVGRPVLLASDTVENIAVRKIVVAWEDTHETRRLLTDAIPLLIEAEEVTIVPMALSSTRQQEGSFGDVITFLAAYGIEAKAKSTSRPGMQLKTFDPINENNLRLVLASHSGHKRLRERVIGGVTRILLNETRPV